MVFIVLFFVALIVTFITWLIIIWARMSSGHWNKTSLLIGGVITAAGFVIMIVSLVLALK